MAPVLAACPTARRDEGSFIAARGLSDRAPATLDPWSLYLGGKRWGDSTPAWIFPFLSFFRSRASTKILPGFVCPDQRRTRSRSCGERVEIYAD